MRDARPNTGKDQFMNGISRTARRASSAQPLSAGRALPFVMLCRYSCRRLKPRNAQHLRYRFASNDLLLPTFTILSLKSSPSARREQGAAQAPTAGARGPDPHLFAKRTHQGIQRGGTPLCGRPRAGLAHNGSKATAPDRCAAAKARPRPRARTTPARCAGVVRATRGSKGAAPLR